ncbi:hypothetical protein [Demequina pelophila]|uniref:hypothetical protein n=1 Tax=Demequina pelophila TaxID=1638984 RepID=UPI000780D446|nr:hypothetical protein [Demequina pelophila]
MSREDRLRNAARTVTGDESILDVAEFMPQEVADALALSTLEDKRPRHVATMDPQLAKHLGADLADNRTELPPHVCLAVSPTLVYVLGLPHGFWTSHPDDSYLMGTFRRDQLEVHVKGRIADRVLTLIDSESGAQMALVADRLSAYHPKALIELLLMGPRHQEDEDPGTVDPSPDQPQG